MLLWYLGCVYGTNTGTSVLTKLYTLDFKCSFYMVLRYIQLLCLLNSSWLWQFLRFLLHLMTLTVLRSSIFAECPSNWVCLMFIMVRLRIQVFCVEDHVSQVPFASHYIKGTYYQHEFSGMMLNLTTWLSWCLLNFFTSKLFLGSPTLYSLKVTKLIQKVWGVILHLFERGCT